MDGDSSDDTFWNKVHGSVGTVMGKDSSDDAL